MNSYKDLLNLIYSYNPKCIHFTDKSYLQTAEFLARKNVVEKISSQEYDKWEGFKQYLEKQNYMVEDWTQFFNYDLCFRSKIVNDSIEELGDIMININIVCPLYSIYLLEMDSGKAKFEPQNDFEKSVFDRIKLITKEVYSYQLLDPEWAKRIIPDVSIGNSFLGSATTFECLFSDHIS